MAALCQELEQCGRARTGVAALPVVEQLAGEFLQVRQAFEQVLMTLLLDSGVL
jgi:hypothetical protein